MGRIGLIVRCDIEIQNGLEQINQITETLKPIVDQASFQKTWPVLEDLTQIKPDVYGRIITSLPRLDSVEKDRIARYLKSSVEKSLTELDSQMQRIGAIPGLRDQIESLRPGTSSMTRGYQELIEHANRLRPEPHSYVEVFISDVPDQASCSAIGESLVEKTAFPALGGHVATWAGNADSSFRVWTVYDPSDFAIRMFPPPARFVVQRHQIFVDHFRLESQPPHATK